MRTLAITERTRSFLLLSIAVLLAALLSWYPLYRAQNSTAMFSPSSLLLIYGLPIHFIIAWMAIRGFLMLLIPTIREGRANRDWIVLLTGGVMALAGISPLLIFAQKLMSS